MFSPLLANKIGFSADTSGHVEKRLLSILLSGVTYGRSNYLITHTHAHTCMDTISSPLSPLYPSCSLWLALFFSFFLFCFFQQWVSVLFGDLTDDYNPGDSLSDNSEELFPSFFLLSSVLLHSFILVASVAMSGAQLRTLADFKVFSRDILIMRYFRQLHVSYQVCGSVNYYCSFISRSITEAHFSQIFA